MKFLRFLFYWALSLAIFSLVAVVWFGDLPSYSGVLEAGNSLFLVSVGQQDLDELEHAALKPGIMIFHIVFLLVNIVGFVTFLSGLMADTMLGLEDHL